jgi:hypothetical protein
VNTDLHDVNTDLGVANSDLQVVNSEVHELNFGNGDGGTAVAARPAGAFTGRRRGGVGSGGFIATRREARAVERPAGRAATAEGR